MTQVTQGPQEVSVTIALTKVVATRLDVSEAVNVIGDNVL